METENLNIAGNVVPNHLKQAQRVYANPSFSCYPQKDSVPPNRVSLTDKESISNTLKSTKNSFYKPLPYLNREANDLWILNVSSTRNTNLLKDQPHPWTWFKDRTSVFELAVFYFLKTKQLHLIECITPSQHMCHWHSLHHNHDSFFFFWIKSKCFQILHKGCAKKQVRKLMFAKSGKFFLN